MEKLKQSIHLQIDGQPVTVPTGTTLISAAEQLDIQIPVLCHQPGLRPVGVCRLCVVDVGARVLAAACIRPCEEGMRVKTHSPSIHRHRQNLVTMLMDDYPKDSMRQRTQGNDALLQLHAALQTSTDSNKPKWSVNVVPAVPRKKDHSSVVIRVDHQACILCDRCIRACNEVQYNHVIGRTGKGRQTQIGFDLNQPMGQSSCVSCGECMAACPTSALTNRYLAERVETQ